MCMAFGEDHTISFLGLPEADLALFDLPQDTRFVLNPIFSSLLMALVFPSIPNATSTFNICYTPFIRDNKLLLAFQFPLDEHRHQLTRNFYCTVVLGKNITKSCCVIFHDDFSDKSGSSMPDCCCIIC